MRSHRWISGVLLGVVSCFALVMLWNYLDAVEPIERSQIGVPELIELGEVDAAMEIEFVVPIENRSNREVLVRGAELCCQSQVRHCPTSIAAGETESLVGVLNTYWEEGEIERDGSLFVDGGQMLVIDFRVTARVRPKEDTP